MHIPDKHSLYALEEVVNGLLNLLAERGIIIDFMGDWDGLAPLVSAAELTLRSGKVFDNITKR